VNIRISKYLSSAGICSRRDAEKLIVEKKIKINYQVCLHPSHKVSNLDIIKVNNKIVKKAKIIPKDVIDKLLILKGSSSSLSKSLRAEPKEDSSLDLL